MTTLYKPVLIETAEQAEALPIGTVAHATETGAQGASLHWVAVKFGPGTWARTDIADGLPMIDDATMVDAESPWVALVSIEAEEETVVDTADLNLDPEYEYWSDDPNLLDAVRDAPKRTRLVTAWTRTEEA